MSGRQCKTDPNKILCYICEELTFAKEKRRIISHIKKMYKAYFNCYLRDQDKSWAPNVCCLTRVKTISAWYAGKNVHMKFVVLIMIWREQKDHSNDWYFCQDHFTDSTTAKKKKHIVYPNFQSAKRPVEHSENLPVPKPPYQEMQSSSSADEHSSGEYVEPNDPDSENKPIPFSQETLNDLCRDFYLTKEKSKFLGSRLQERNLLEKGVKMPLYRKRIEDLLALFTVNNSLFIIHYTKFCWVEYYIRKDWPIRDKIEQGKHNIMDKPLVKSDRIFLPPLHIKLRLFKKFVKALGKEASAFCISCRKVPFPESS